MTTTYVFGPVRSRRLGFSLGVDLVPYKTCSLDCPYCQLGRTTHKTIERFPGGDPDAVVTELMGMLQGNMTIDFITLSGSGEPTLSTSLGTVIRCIKERTSFPVAVLTNSTLLHRETVRRELLEADLVVPSLDAVSEDVFRRVNRPHPLLSAMQLIDGLRQFREEYQGQLWLEIMLLQGINDLPDELEKMKKVIENIPFDRIQLNTPVRPAWDSSVKPLSAAELSRIRDWFGATCEIIAATGQTQRRQGTNVEERIISIIRRRPLNLLEIADSLGMPRSMVGKYLAALEAQGRVTVCRYGGELFYRINR